MAFETLQDVEDFIDERFKDIPFLEEWDLQRKLDWIISIMLTYEDADQARRDRRKQ